MKSEQYGAAIEIFADVLKIAEREKVRKFSHIYKSQCHRYLGEYSQAIEEINKAIEMDEKDVLSFFDRIHIKEEMRDWSGVISDAEHILSSDLTESQTGNAHYYIGTALYFQGKYKKALKSFTKSLKIQPNDVEVLYRMARAKEGLGDYESAISDYSSIIELNSTVISAYIGRGNAKIMKIRKENNDIVVSIWARDACSDFKKAKELGSNEVDVQLSLYCNCS